MNTRILLILATSAIVGCATTASTATPTSPNGEADGLSCERRVKVGAIPEEYAWVKEHYPGADVTMQSLSDCGGSPVDKLHLKTADGKTVITFFDISTFF